MKYKTTEIYETIQGEGIYQGIPSILIRVAGCNLACRWCDSDSDREYQLLDLKSIREIIMTYSSKNIIITGGEPMIVEGLEDMCNFLADNGYHITIETNGSIYRKVKCDLISISPKLLNSNPYGENNYKFKQYEQKRLCFDSLNRLVKEYNYQMKFVINDENDLLEILEILNRIKDFDASKVFLMPNARNYNELKEKQLSIVRLCIKYGLRYANRLQLQIWNEDENEKKCVKNWGNQSGSL